MAGTSHATLRSPPRAATDRPKNHGGTSCASSDRGSFMASLETAFEEEPTAPGHERPASACKFTLIQEIDELRDTPQYRNTGHAARTLFKRPELRIVLIVLRRDAELTAHRTHQPVSIQTV